MAEKVEWLSTKAGEAAPEPLILTEEEFVRRYAGTHCEWVGGVVVPMSPSSLQHMLLIGQLYLILRTYFELRPIGSVLSQPFSMRLETPERVSRREPDVMIVLNTHRDRIKPTFLDGPADLVIEVVSPESTARDHGEKLAEYEAASVPEYWIIDPERRDARFFRMAEGKYRAIPTADGLYQTPILPGLRLTLTDLWTTDYPGPAAVVAAVQAMLKDS